MAGPLSDDTRQAIILVEVFGLLSIVIMAARLVMRKVRRQSYILSDYLTMFAIVCVLNRTGMTTVVLLWGNNNMSAAARKGYVFTERELYERTVGSQLTLANRAVYNTYLWIQKGVVLLLFDRILSCLPFMERIILSYWAILVATWAAVEVTTFSECSPRHLYWQVDPDPGTCTKAQTQLFTLVVMNVFTDMLLIALPMPFLLRMRRSLIERLQLTALFSIGVFLIAVALIRLPVWGSTAQVNRNTWGSVEQFAAALVANVPTLYTLRKRRPDAIDVSGRRGTSNLGYGTGGSALRKGYTNPVDDEGDGEGGEGTVLERLRKPEVAYDKGSLVANSAELTENMNRPGGRKQQPWTRSDARLSRETSGESLIRERWS